MKNNAILGVSAMKYMAFLLLIVSVPAMAEKKWLFQGVYVEHVTLMNVSGSVAVQIKISDTHVEDAYGQLAYSCSPTESGSIVSHWNSSMTDLQKSLLTTAMAAQAQRFKVDILVDDNNCNANNSWINNHDFENNGLGLEWSGIKIRAHEVVDISP